MRKNIVAGNWKMNLDAAAANQLVSEVLAGLAQAPAQAETVFCPSYIHLSAVQALAKGASGVAVGAQNCHAKASGAYTGEIAAAMLASYGIGYVILGHSERRQYFKETNQELAEKVNIALANNLKVIFCCGEVLDERNQGKQEQVVQQQLAESLFHLSEAQFANTVIAYEPVWAIGTGVTATSAQAQEMHAAIRQMIAARYGTTVANDTSILYGGSCNATNAKELFACPDVDGGLIGGASLKSADFLTIIRSF